VLVALLTLGPHIQTGQHHGRELLRHLTTESFEPIANVLVILAAAGGLSGVLRDSGAAQATVSLALGAHMPPLCWRGSWRRLCECRWDRLRWPWLLRRRCWRRWLGTPACGRSCWCWRLDGVADPVACERSGVLDDSVVFQAGSEGHAGHVVGDGNGSVGGGLGTTLLLAMALR